MYHEIELRINRLKISSGELQTIQNTFYVLAAILDLPPTGDSKSFLTKYTWVIPQSITTAACAKDHLAT